MKQTVAESNISEVFLVVLRLSATVLMRDKVEYFGERNNRKIIRTHLTMDLSNFKQFAETSEAHSHDPRTIWDQEQVSVNSNRSGLHFNYLKSHSFVEKYV